MIMGEGSKFGLSKQDILTDVKLIDKVFKASLSIKAFPLIFSYNLLEKSNLPIQVLFSVPKRKFKKAVDRNRIKRLMKECFRLKKPELLEALNGQSIYGAFIYTNKEISDFQSIDKSIAKIIAKLNENHRH